jgi:hypothetical protein
MARKTAHASTLAGAAAFAPGRRDPSQPGSRLQRYMAAPIVKRLAFAAALSR